MKRKRAGRSSLVAILVAGGIVVAGLGVTEAFVHMGAESARERTSAAIGGAFTLVDDNGAKVTQQTLLGKPSVIYFGYTYCPDICPTTLTDLSTWIQALGADADKLNYIFVTIDPARDTVPVMHQYVHAFDRRLRGFTGTQAEIAKIAEEYRVYYKRVATKTGYEMDHSSFIYLMGPDGRFVDVINTQDGRAAAIAKLRRLVVPGNST